MVIHGNECVQANRHQPTDPPYKPPLPPLLQTGGGAIDHPVATPLSSRHQSRQAEEDNGLAEVEGENAVLEEGEVTEGGEEEVNKTVNVQQLRKEMREERNAELGGVKNMLTAISLKLGIPESPDSWVENLSQRRYPVQAGEQGL
ncbi:hypothetical protein Pelo_9472 [Pelomyxa schiedti]|nr:hypothetical protein Pelo_9472 [Pelomyxa schiedti]